MPQARGLGHEGQVCRRSWGSKRAQWGGLRSSIWGESEDPYRGNVVAPQEGLWARQPHGRLCHVRQNEASWSRAQPLEGGSRSRPPASFAAGTSPAPSGARGQ